MTIGGGTVRIVWHSPIALGYPLAWAPLPVSRVHRHPQHRRPGRSPPGYIREMRQCTRTKAPFWLWDLSLGPCAWDPLFHARTTKLHAEKAWFYEGPQFGKKAVFAAKWSRREGNSGISVRSTGEVQRAVLAKLSN